MDSGFFRARLSVLNLKVANAFSCDKLPITFVRTVIVGSTYQFVHILSFCIIELHLDLMALSLLSMLLVLSTSNQFSRMN